MIIYILQKGIKLLFRVGNTVFLVIDLRFHRTYNPNDSNILLGEKQYKYIESELKV